MKMTPRKLQALLRVHYEIQRQKYGHKKEDSNETVNGYIDTIPGW